ncbi:ATP-binding protein [Sporosarcina soli]|uniref:ATP-binding protein n=1 Tax=Sporosarcina soli TaxID=334736 RepID=A0ABW0TGC0_9BACL
MNAVRESLESNPIEILTSPSEDCPFRRCDGTGFIWIKDWSKRHKKNVVDEWKEECECYDQLIKQREIDKKLDLSGIPPIFKDATVRSFRTDIYQQTDSRERAVVARKAAINYVTNFEVMQENGKGLYLYSDVKGSGKTRLAVSIANALVSQHGVDVAFIKSMDLISQVRKTFKNDSELTESEVVESYRKVGLLVIDDLAIKGASEFEERIFYDITDYRLEHNKPTLFTSNVSIDSLEDFYPGGRVGKRIKKMSLEIYMPEESIRDQEADSENDDFEKILFGN